MIKQEAQWACIAHMVFAIYIPLSKDVTKIAKYQCNQISDLWKKDVSSFLLYKPI